MTHWNAKKAQVIDYGMNGCGGGDLFEEFVEFGVLARPAVGVLLDEVLVVALVLLDAAHRFVQVEACHQIVDDLLHLDGAPKSDLHARPSPSISVSHQKINLKPPRNPFSFNRPVPRAISFVDRFDGPHESIALYLLQVVVVVARRGKVLAALVVVAQHFAPYVHLKSFA